MFVLLANILSGCYNSEQIDDNGLTPQREVQLTRDEAQACKKITDYSFNIFSLLLENYDETDFIGNDAFSPLGLWMITSQAIKFGNDDQILKFANRMLNTDDISDLDKLNLKLYEELPKVDDSVIMEQSNLLWTDWINLAIFYTDEHLDLLKKYYNSELFLRNMKEKSTVDEFNNWCEEKTHGRISDVVKDDKMRGDIVYANAIYFKGEWTQKLNVLENQNFTNIDGTISHVKMMEQYTDSYIFTLDKRRCAYLPMGNGAFGVYFVLPDGDETIQHCAKWIADGAGEDMINLKLNK